MRRLPESSLTALVEDTRALLQGELDRSTAYDVASRLSVLQWMQHEDLPALLARALESPSMDLRAMAMDVKLESVGLAEWSQRLYAMWRKGSIEDAPYNDEQRIAIAAHDIIRGVQNGGLCNLYANGAQRCRFAYRQLAYRAVGASKLAHVIERADAIFGPDGPPEEQEAREDRVGELFDEMDDSPLFFEFCEHDSEALYLTSCYVLEHRDRILERLPDLAAR